MTQTQKPPTWFWIIVGIALLWNLMGLMAFFAQILTPPEEIAALPDAQRALYEAMPVWAIIAFAVAVFCGTLGCVALAMRKNWAMWMFKLSLAGVILQNINAFFLQDSYAVFGPGGSMMVVLVAVVAIALIWLTWHAKNNNWLS